MLGTATIPAVTSSSAMPRPKLLATSVQRGRSVRWNFVAIAEISFGWFAECVGSGIHSAINGKIRPGNVRRLRTGDERHQRGDLINTPIAVERCDGLLRHRPIARRGIQIRVDRTRLDVVDRDTPAPDLSGQPLSKHLYGSLRGRIGHQPGH